MTKSKYIVAPEVLEKREFDFTPYQRDQIYMAKLMRKKVRAEILTIGGKSHLFAVEIILNGDN